MNSARRPPPLERRPRAVRDLRRRPVRAGTDLRWESRCLRVIGEHRDVPRPRHRRGDVYAGRPVAVATVLEHPNAAVVGRRLVVRPSSAGDGGSQPGMIIDSLKADARHLLAAGRSECLSYGPKGAVRGGVRVFVQSSLPHHA